MTTLAPEAAGELVAESASAWRLFWERLREDKLALAGAVTIIVLALLAIFGGPLAAALTHHRENQTFYNGLNDFGTPLGPRWHTPDGTFLFGFDSAGRDLFVRVMYGTRTSLLVGVVASGIAVFVGLVVGLIA